MEIYYKQSTNRPTVMTLGTFDGVHTGHQQIINLTIKEAEKLNCDSALFTFASHPLNTVAPKEAPKALVSWRQKRRVIQSVGIQQLIVQKFTKEFASLPYERFVKEYLVDRFNVKKIIVGEDFRCGAGGLGTASSVAELGEKYGFSLEAIPTIQLKQQKIGSSQIRNLVLAGKLEEAREQLGRNLTLDCKVVTGDQRGRKLGFPTANLVPAVDYVLPPLGVYACKIRLKDKIYNGVVHLGLVPTFNKNKFSIEVFIFDFNQNIYDQSLELEMISRLRTEEKFNSKEELIAQMKKDVQRAKEILNR